MVISFGRCTLARRFTRRAFRCGRGFLESHFGSSAFLLGSRRFENVGVSAIWSTCEEFAELLVDFRFDHFPVASLGIFLEREICSAVVE